jgi:hypothetical protein
MQLNGARFFLSWVPAFSLPFIHATLGCLWLQTLCSKLRNRPRFLIGIVWRSDLKASVFASPQVDSNLSQ